MTILIVHAPGHASGPCREKCIHPHCWELKQAAAARCATCGDSIGYNRSYIQLKNQEVHHTDCVNHDVEQRR